MPLTASEQREFLQEFGALGANLENLTELVRLGFQRIEQDRAAAAEERATLTKKFDDLAYDMRQLPQLRADHTALKRQVDENTEFLRDVRRLKLDERLSKVEGVQQGQAKWLWFSRTLLALILTVLGAIFWLLDRWQTMRDFIRAPGPH